MVFLDEHRENPDRYDGLGLPAWLDELSRPWVIVPLMQGDSLVGFVVLTQSPIRGALNWEDSDLLKTVGRQAASFLEL